VNPLRVVVEKYSAAFLAAPFFFFFFGGGLSRSMMPPPVVLAPAFFLEAVAEALLFFGLHRRGWRLVLVPFVVGRVIGVAVVRVRR